MTPAGKAAQGRARRRRRRGGSQIARGKRAPKTESATGDIALIYEGINSLQCPVKELCYNLNYYCQQL